MRKPEHNTFLPEAEGLIVDLSALPRLSEQHSLQLLHNASLADTSVYSYYSADVRLALCQRSRRCRGPYMPNEIHKVELPQSVFRQALINTAYGYPYSLDSIKDADPRVLAKAAIREEVLREMRG